MTKKAVVAKSTKKVPCSVTRGKPPECMMDFSGFFLYKIAQYMQEEFDSFFKNLHIRGRHFVVLHVVIHEGPLAQQALCDGLWIDRATMVGVIQKLARLGLVKKRSHPQDKRSYLISATEKGQVFYRQHQENFARLEKKLFPQMTEQELEELKVLLRKSLLALVSPVGARTERRGLVFEADVNSPA